MEAALRGRRNFTSRKSDQLPIIVNLEIEGKMIPMEVDTGAA